jgi:peptide/nickel transport system substrate-binding protein
MGFGKDPTTLMANVLAGVELTLGRALSFDQALQMREQWRDGTIATRLSAALPIMPQFINPNPPIVADLRFRRALLHAIDRQEIVDSMMAGEAEVAHSFVSPALPAYATIEPHLVKYELNPARAVQMLEDLGYVRAADGTFNDASNQKLAVQIYTAAQNDRNPKVTGAVAGHWRQLGVTVEQVIIPIQRFQDVEYRAQFPAFEITATAGGISVRDIIRYHSSSTPLPENQFRARGNSARYRNPELDGFLDRYLTTIRMQDRLEALAGMVHHQTENVTMLPVFFDVGATMVGNRLRNVAARGDRYTEAWNAHEWDLKP